MTTYRPTGQRRQSIGTGLCVLLFALPLAACGAQSGAPSAYVATAEAGDSETGARAAIDAGPSTEELQLASYQSCIRSVFEQDSRTDLPSYAGRLQAMRQIDTSTCPSEFRTAYFDHIQAWDQRRKVSDAWQQLNNKDNQDATVLASIVATVFGLDATPIQDHLEAEQRLRAAEADAQAAVSNTYHAVERVALLYGIGNG